MAAGSAHGQVLPCRPVVDVRLRPFADEADVDLLLAVGPHGAESEYDDFGPRSDRSVRARFAEDGLLEPDRGHLVVEADGEAVGDVQWFARPYGPVPGTAAWTIGISLLPAARGKGVGRRAQRLLAEHLFAHTPAHRVEASTDVTNVAEQRALEAAGFTREGVLRGAQWRRGQWHDLVLYAVVRTDLEES